MISIRAGSFPLSRLPLPHVIGDSANLIGVRHVDQDTIGNSPSQASHIGTESLDTTFFLYQEICTRNSVQELAFRTQITVSTRRAGRRFYIASIISCHPMCEFFRASSISSSIFFPSHSPSAKSLDR